MQKFKPLETSHCPFTNLPEKRAGRWGAGLTDGRIRTDLKDRALRFNEMLYRVTLSQVIIWVDEDLEKFCLLTKLLLNYTALQPHSLPGRNRVAGRPARKKPNTVPSSPPIPTKAAPIPAHPQWGRIAWASRCVACPERLQREALASRNAPMGTVHRGAVSLRHIAPGGGRRPCGCERFLSRFCSR